MADDLIIETECGRVKGARAKRVRRWLGVPYASAQRFALAQPARPWSGVRAAKTMAPQCPQGMGKRVMTEAPAFGEDCLALNIWSPPADGKARPVLFWIHGGAFLAGSVNPYDGAELAKRGDMVVVGINYRVGVLGFVNFGEALGLPSIPSNLGLRDQIAALRWVHHNIAAFGGDPNRVTICGQSAGSMSVSLLMLCQQAWPYFQGAIMQSGAVSLIHDRETSLRVGRRYAEVLDLNQGDFEKLKTLDVKTLLDAQTAVQASVAVNTIPAAPWFDGDVLPATLKDAHTAPCAPAPLMAGFAREEIRLFELMGKVMGGPDILPMKQADLEQLLRQQLPAAQAEQVLAAYPKTKAGRTALATDLTFGMPTRNFAERHAQHQPCYFYRFDYKHPIVGAAHGVDLLFMWPMYGLMGALMRGGTMSGRRRKLADRIKSHLIHFTHHGRPDESWPAFSSDRRATLILNLKDNVVDDPEAERRRAWQGKDVGPGIAEPVFV